MKLLCFNLERKSPMDDNNGCSLLTMYAQPTPLILISRKFACLAHEFVTGPICSGDDYGFKKHGSIGHNGRVWVKREIAKMRK